MLKATGCLKYMHKKKKKRQSLYAFYTWGHFSIYGISILSLASKASLRNWSVGFFLGEEKIQIWRTSKLKSVLENLKPQQQRCKVLCILVVSSPILYLGRWYCLSKLHFWMASLSIEFPVPAKEDAFLYPVLTLSCPTALVFVPAPTDQTAWCCTEIQSAGSVHCHRCETSLLQHQRDPGSAGKKGETQIGSYIHC